MDMLPETLYVVTWVDTQSETQHKWYSDLTDADAADANLKAQGSSSALTCYQLVQAPRLAPGTFNLDGPKDIPVQPETPADVPVDPVKPSKKAKEVSE